MSPATHLMGFKQKEDLLSRTIELIRKEERVHIGQELHDNVNQILMSAKLLLEMISPETDHAKELKERSLEYILLAIREIRKISRELVMEDIASLQLLDSIKRLIGDLNLATPVRFELDFDEQLEDLSPVKKITLYRIIQEQLKNIMSHSKASEVMIIAKYIDDRVTLEIQDNGIGFDPNKEIDGMGLNSIHMRTRNFNGSMKIHSSEGCGCKLSIVIPAA